MLEAIDVEKQQREGVVESARSVERRFDLLPEELPIRKGRQRVEVGEMADALLCLDARRDVAGGRLDAAVGEAARGKLGPDPSVAALEG